MNIFDIIGPVMIGPSCSDAAGAVKIGRVIRALLGEEPTDVVVKFYGSFAKTYKGHGTELNACLGKIVACPTAGSCGIMPAVLLTYQEENNIPDDKIVISLFTAPGIGMVIAKQASISGAEDGLAATPTARKIAESFV